MLTDRKQINKIAILFTFAYMVSYMTRINYGAIVSEMVLDTGITKSLLSLALTGSFITYGIGQIISGMCGDKFSPKKLVTLGLVVTVLMNALIPFCQNEYQMLAVWCVNGFAQSFMWPPIVKLMTGLLSSDDYNRIMVKVQMGCSIGTIAVYLLSPLLIYIYGWQLVFFFCAAVGAVMTFFWCRYCIDIAPEKKIKTVSNENTQEENGNSRTIAIALAVVMVAIVLMGMLRDGVTTWMPSYLSETYELSSIISILTGVVLPCLGFVCFQSASIIYRKKLHNPILCALIFFTIATVVSGILVLISGNSAFFSVALFSILAGCMHGVNMMLICTVPRFFKKGGKVSTISGILNACTYVGSALSTYGIAIIAEGSGWSTTLTILFILALVGSVFTALAAIPWSKCFGNKEFE